jgi:hypothetical protein
LRLPNTRVSACNTNHPLDKTGSFRDLGESRRSQALF